MMIPDSLYKRRLQVLTRDLCGLGDDTSEWACDLRMEIRIRIAEVVRIMLEEDDSNDA